MTAGLQDRKAVRLIRTQQCYPDTDHPLMFLIAYIGVFHLQEVGAWELFTLSAVPEPLLIDRAVVQRADL